MKNLWLLAAALLCACQQNREAGPPPAEASQARPAERPADNRPADNRPVIACFGDSLTAGFGLEPGQSYPDVLQKELDRRGYRYRVANFGVSGDTTQDGLARLPMVAADKPAVVVLEFGANDGLRGQPVPSAEASLRQMIEAFQQAGAKVVLAGITLPPNYGPDYIRRFNAMYTDLAARYRLTLIPFFLEGVATHTELMQRDGLHPTAAGARIAAELVLKYLEPLLRK